MILSGAKEAVEKLISNGCKQIGLITTKDYISVGRLRSLGYMNALKAHGVIPNSELILKVDDDLVSEDHLEVLEDEITQLFKVNPTIDAIFAVNELYAVTAMKVARKLNINIPEQLANYWFYRWSFVQTCLAILVDCQSARGRNGTTISRITYRSN